MKAPMFPARQERLDWQLIAELEPLVVAAGSREEIGRCCLVDVLCPASCLEKLQAVLAGLAFCSVEQEFGREVLEATRGLAKIFRLSQLVIQYLMYCQVRTAANTPNIHVTLSHCRTSSLSTLRSTARGRHNSRQTWPSSLRDTRLWRRRSRHSGRRQRRGRKC